MDMAEDLAGLAAHYGIASEYYDIWGERHVTTELTRRVLLRAMHVPVDDEGPSALLDHLQNDAWIRPLPPVLIVRSGAPIRLDLNLPVRVSCSPCRWTLTLEDGDVRRGQFAADTLPRLGENNVGGIAYRRYALELPPLDTTGYHRFGLEYPDTNSCLTMPLIIVPAACYQPESIRGEGRVWGLAVQLYGLRSNRNWGIGDFTDLRGLVNFTADYGGAIVGVNPLHALFGHDAGHVSPYSPSSRAFVNALYLDVEAIPEFLECEAAQALVASTEFRARQQCQRAGELVDYAAVAAAKLEVLRLVYRHFRERHLNAGSERAVAFRRYLDAGGTALEQLARFEAIQAWMYALDRAIWGWPVWPEKYRDPDSPAVAEFAVAHADAVTFHAWLQWLADDQLAEVGREALRRGLGIGLYLDLAVGASPGGAETWRWQRVFADAHAGAPPDDFSLQGQDWGVPAFVPHLLREAAYAPLVELLRANMRHAGALRIDHVMGLVRLFWVPAGGTPGEGTYVAYPLEELLGIIALESQRNRCLVVGEDLGTVPDGLRPRLAECGLLSYRPMLFERDGTGGFKPPGAYPRQSLVCAGTHDLPTLAGMWSGADLSARSALGLFPSTRQHEALLAERAEDRTRLLAALAHEQLLPAGYSGDPDRVPRLDHRLVMAIHAYLARTPSQVLMVQPEDVLGVEPQANLPGSRDDQHPNWHRRLPLGIDGWRDDQRFIDLQDVLRREHRSTVAPHC